MSKEIRILLADDHPLIRSGLHNTLAQEPDFVIVGEAIDSEDVLHLCQRHKLDILLLDLNMPGDSATQTVAELKQNYPDLKILVLTAYDDEAYIRAMTMLDVDGYLLKDEAPDVVIQAIHVIMAGNSWFGSSIIKKLTYLHSNRQIPSTKLTERDQELLMLLTHGLDNASMAQELNLSPQTVRNNLTNLYAKIEVSSRIKATIWAIKHGFEPRETD